MLSCARLKRCEKAAGARARHARSDRTHRAVLQPRPEAFNSDELIQNWIVHHLQILGEAARALPEPVRAEAPAIEWKKITGMRHVLVHDYFGIDQAIVWNTVERELPPLKASLQELVIRLGEP